MIRVAVETATRVGSVAVARDGDVLAAVELGVQTRHAAAALPALDEVLRTAGVDRSDIGAVVVGAGPGSFTGVRVAAATAKGLATGLGVPLLAYSSLLALAVDAVDGDAAGRPVAAFFDARRGEVYGGAWRVAVDGLRPVLAPCVAAMAEVVDRLAAALSAGAGEDGGVAEVLFVGDGAAAYRDALTAAADAAGLAARVGPEGARPTASALLWLAHHHTSAGAVEDVAGWEPLYVRGSSAERGIRG